MNTKPTLPPNTTEPGSPPHSGPGSPPPKTLDIHFNPPAYPFVLQTPEGCQVNPGAMLRDVMAIAAMQALLERYQMNIESQTTNIKAFDHISFLSYVMADAMLEQRMQK